ncbi:hypothetical protein Tco_0314012 [Tanacetum coccineum]
MIRLRSGFSLGTDNISLKEGVLQEEKMSAEGGLFLASLQGKTKNTLKGGIIEFAWGICPCGMVSNVSANIGTEGAGLRSRVLPIESRMFFLEGLLKSPPTTSFHLANTSLLLEVILSVPKSRRHRGSSFIARIDPSSLFQMVPSFYLRWYDVIIKSHGMAQTVKWLSLVLRYGTSMTRSDLVALFGLE